MLRHHGGKVAPASGHHRPSILRHQKCPRRHPQAESENAKSEDHDSATRPSWRERIRVASSSIMDILVVTSGGNRCACLCACVGRGMARGLAVKTPRP